MNEFLKPIRFAKPKVNVRCSIPEWAAMAQKAVVTDKAAQMLIPSYIWLDLVDILTFLLHNLDEDCEKNADEGKHRWLSSWNRWNSEARTNPFSCPVYSIYFLVWKSISGEKDSHWKQTQPLTVSRIVNERVWKMIYIKCNSFSVVCTVRTLKRWNLLEELKQLFDRISSACTK